MPPRIPVRFPWASRQPALQLNASLHARSFTSTPPSQALGPESPNYIDVPKTVQPTYDPKPRVKGVLPIPRNVFKTRSPIPKESPEFIDASTQDKQNVKPPPAHARDVEFTLYKRRLAETRKTALREGVRELHERKTQTEEQHAAYMDRHWAEMNRARFAPPKDFDIMTTNSVQKGIRDFLEDQLPSTSRSKITEGRRMNYRRRMEKHAAMRQARLHDLYINAREFIVDEEQLDEAIEKAFGTEQSPVRWNSKGEMGVGYDGKSPWEGPIPEGAGDMLQKLRTGEGVGLARERIKRVAEELTGGKM
ncbi:hypothetical protein BDV96DRAFT_583740 [Lophiotrema nucula]|uniref:Uncharacterized protein n=1 Tax=Lophiotrema nucula TaxID=690887 RepID=A0A6A5YT93_9PLEO|nr:hypothetical protein BDV96DRAFT_583740 [Lophiotrema nucula]